MIVYICPKCGGDLQEIVLTSYPAQYQKYCSNCGWTHIEKEKIYRIPYTPDTSSFSILTDNTHYDEFGFIDPFSFREDNEQE